VKTTGLNNLVSVWAFS